MAVITITSGVRAVDLPSEGWAPCCGRVPVVFTWPQGIGKGLIGITCQNPACPNHTEGVLAYEGDAAATWERWRQKQEGEQ